MRRRNQLPRFLVGLLAAFGILTSPLEALVPDAHDGDASVVQLEADGSRHEHGSTPAPGDDNHAMHICHCVHSHSGMPTRAGNASENGIEHTDAPAFRPTAPSTPTPAEFFRPPIA